jgi:hypothetical protein
MAARCQSFLEMGLYERTTPLPKGLQGNRHGGAVAGQSLVLDIAGTVPESTGSAGAGVVNGGVSASRGQIDGRLIQWLWEKEQWKICLAEY